MTSKAITDVLAERQRQITSEGWTLEHDDQHDDKELALVAALYATPTPLFLREELENGTIFADPWPETWESEWDRRTDFPERRRLIVAAALLIAEIERLDRQAGPT